MRQLAVVLAVLSKLVLIFRLGLRNIPKRITSLIFSNIYTPPQHALTHIILFVFFFVFLVHLLFSLYLTIIVVIFYCLNNTSLLLHLTKTHLVAHLSLSCIVFIISTLIIGIFDCLSYTSLLLHLIISHLVIDFIITM